MANDTKPADIETTGRAAGGGGGRSARTDRKFQSTHKTRPIAVPIAAVMERMIKNQADLQALQRRGADRTSV
jgi:hypothetical protein